MKWCDEQQLEGRGDQMSETANAEVNGELLMAEFHRGYATGQKDALCSPCDRCEAYAGIAADFEEAKSCLRSAYEQFAGFVGLATRQRWEKSLHMKPSLPTDHSILDSEVDVYRRLKAQIADLEKHVLYRVVQRVRAPYYCHECNKEITRHAAQTLDGNWHHLGCITKAPSLHYKSEDERVLDAQWTCGCGHINGPNMATCAACGRRPGPKWDLSKNREVVQ
jgi:hypothetical protein